MLVYTFDQTAPEKRDRARALVAETLASGQGLASYGAGEGRAWMTVQLRSMSIKSIGLPTLGHTPPAVYVTGVYRVGRLRSTRSSAPPGPGLGITYT